MMATLGAFFLPKLAKYGIWLLLGLAVVVTVLAAIAGLKRAGALQERVETMKRTIDAVKTREEIRNEIVEDKRTTGRSSVDVLRDEWSRD